MLVLTRKEQERIRIGGNVEITILKLKGNAVRVGIEAPDDVQIIRGELEDHCTGGDRGERAEHSCPSVPAGIVTRTRPGKPICS